MLTQGNVPEHSAPGRSASACGDRLKLIDSRWKSAQANRRLLSPKSRTYRSIPLYRWNPRRPRDRMVQERRAYLMHRERPMHRVRPMRQQVREPLTVRMVLETESPQWTETTGSAH